MTFSKQFVNVCIRNDYRMDVYTQMHPSMSNNVSDQNSRVNEGSSHALSAVYHIMCILCKKSWFLIKLKKKKKFLTKDCGNT